MVDIKSAFDKAWCPAILAALGKRQCPRYLIKLIHSFLTDRTAILETGNAELEVEIQIGCPQGSLISPFLWNILVDDLLRSFFPFSFSILAYADDLTLTATHKDKHQATRNLQNMVDVISKQLELIKLETNATKTVFMLFSRKITSDSDLFLTLNGLKINVSCSSRLLGLTLDSRLQWFEHLEAKEIAAKKAYHSIRRYVGRNWGLSRQRLKTIYTTLIESSLLYCCLVWASITRTKRGCRKLRAVERRFNILTTRAFKTVHTGALSILAGTLPVDYRILEITLKRYFLSNLSAFSLSAVESLKSHIQRIDKSQPPSQVKMAIKSTISQAWSSEWKEGVQGQATREFFPTPSCFHRLRITNLPHQIVQLITGHCYLNDHQHRFNFISNPLCKCSTGLPETRHHFLFACPLYEEHRRNFREISISTTTKWPPNLTLIHKTPALFIEMIKYVLSTKQLDNP